MYLMRPFGALFPPPTRSAIESSRLRRATRVPAICIGTYGSLKNGHPVSEFEERRWSGFTLRAFHTVLPLVIFFLAAFLALSATSLVRVRVEQATFPLTAGESRAN